MVQVEVNEGVLEGEQTGTYYSFKGIPYAEPPIGELRFQPPQPPKPWEGIRSAKEFGSKSFQFDLFTQTPHVGSEDCLYLNVYTPDLKPKTPLPVMFFIHGGGFSWGSGNDDFYGPQYLVKQGVIVVTINYRLGILGYLCLHTKEIPGNAGMKDQVAALRWVNKNVHNFGGDSKNITIFGQSAGGASVGAHLISPMTEGLFKRAILQSGCAQSSWTQAFEPRERALKVAKLLGCYSENNDELYAFFKAQPIEKFLIQTCSVTFADEQNGKDLSFNIVSEDDFGQERYFYGDFKGPLTKNIHKGVEIMAGYVQNEGVFVLSPSFNNTDEYIKKANGYLEVFVPKKLAKILPIKEQLNVGRRMKKYYFGDQPVTKNSYEQVAKFLGFDMFVYEIINFVKNNETNKCYLYEFRCHSERNFFGKIFDLKTVFGDKPLVNHCDDTAYLFEANYVNQKLEADTKEFELVDRVTKLWTNFAKTGNPTPDSSLGAIWEPFSPELEQYLDIGDTLQLKSKPQDEEYKFWDAIFKKYL